VNRNICRACYEDNHAQCKPPCDCSDCFRKWCTKVDGMLRCADCGAVFETEAGHTQHKCPGRAANLPRILLEAAQLISGPRRESYGPVEESFERVATVWTALLGKRLSAPLTAADIALLMAAFKLCREANSPGFDNRVDAVGYLALLEQIYEAAKKASDQPNTITAPIA